MRRKKWTPSGTSSSHSAVSTLRRISSSQTTSLPAPGVFPASSDCMFRPNYRHLCHITCIYLCILAHCLQSLIASSLMSWSHVPAFCLFLGFLIFGCFLDPVLPAPIGLVCYLLTAYLCTEPASWKVKTVLILPPDVCISESSVSDNQ